MRRTRVFIAILITAMMITLAAPMAAYAGEYGSITPPIVAIPTASIVLVNGGNVAFDAYNINGNNYFKLRDLAFTLNGTAKQFAVGWDGANNAISLTSGQPYEPVGGEMTGKGAGSKEAVPTASKIYMDGKVVLFTAYNIGDNNYFKLRDIGEAFDFGVDWDGAAQTIRIDTSKGYTPEGAQQPVIDPRAPVADESVRGKLVSLEIVGYKLSPDFDPDIMLYTVIVPNNVTSVQVKYNTADMRASVKSAGGADLAVGGNLVSVEVTAENGTVKTYAINVTRQEPKPEGPGDLSNANLKSLLPYGWELVPGFKPDIVEYNILIGPGKSNIDVRCEAEDPKATITITGNTDIPPGKSQILIVVTAQDGTTKTYTITVTRQQMG